MTTDTATPERNEPSEGEPSGAPGASVPETTVPEVTVAAPAGAPAPEPATPGTPASDAPSGGGDVVSSPDGSKPDRKMIIAAVAAVVVFALVVVAAVSFGGAESPTTNPSAPAETTTAFLTAVQKNDLDGAFAELCTPLRGGTAEGVLNPGAVEPLAQAGGLKSFTVGEATITKKDGRSTAISRYELVVGDDVKRPGQAELVLEGDEWKVCSFSV